MRHAPGFTLLEVLVAFVIAALALAALTGAVAGGMRASRVAGATEQAISRAQSRLAAASLALGERSGDDGGGFGWRETVRPAGAAGSAALYDLTVEIDWTADGPHRVVLHTLHLAPLAPRDPP